MYKYIHTCIYIHISCPHTYTHTHIYTHAYTMYIWTHAKHVWNDGAAATARAAQLDTKKLCPSPCPHHDSAPCRPHSAYLHWCGAGPPSLLSTPAPSLAMPAHGQLAQAWETRAQGQLWYTHTATKFFTAHTANLSESVRKRITCEASRIWKFLVDSGTKWVQVWAIRLLVFY